MLRAVVAEKLGLVEGLVGPLDQRLGSIPGLILCETEARRHGGFRVVTVVGDLRSEAFCQAARFSKVCIGRKDDELFPAPAAQPVARSTDSTALTTSRNTLSPQSCP
jgi:hypothetical protein